MAYAGYFLTQSSQPSTDINALKKSHLASDRMRGAVACSTQGINWVCGAPPDRLDGLDYLLVGKPPQRDVSALKEWAKCIGRAVQSGVEVILDYTDHHLGRSIGLPVHEFYRNSLGQASAITVPTRTLQTYLVAFGFLESVIHVIPDVIEQDIRPPKTSLVHNDLSVGLWFGDPSNISYLRQYLFNAGDRAKNWRLILVTSLEFLQDSKLQPGAWTRLIEGPLIFPHIWSLKTIEEAAELCDYALLPGDVSDIGKNGASPNRLLSALSVGLPTITSSVKSHSPFSDYWVDQTDLEGADLLIAQPFRWADKVLDFQKNIAPKFNPLAVTALWEELFDSLRP